MHAFRTYIFYQSLNRLQRGLSAIAELLVNKCNSKCGNAVNVFRFVLETITCRTLKFFIVCSIYVCSCSTPSFSSPSLPSVIFQSVIFSPSFSSPANSRHP